jgi:hypothetical protein
MITIKPKQLQPGMIVLTDYLYDPRVGKMKNNLTIPKPFLVLKVKKNIGFSGQTIKITYLTPRGDVDSFGMTCDYDLVIL